MFIFLGFPFHFSIYSLFVFLSAVVSLILAVSAWKRRDEKPAFYLALIQFSLLAWAVPIIFETAASTLNGKFFWSVVAYPGTIFSPVFVFLFAMVLSQKDTWFTTRNLILLFLPGALIFLFTLTNPWHGLVWPEIILNPVTKIAVYHHGPVFYLLVVYAYLLLTIGGITIFSARKKYSLSLRPQIYLLTFSTAIPFFSNLIYILNLSPFPGVDWTLFGFILSGVLLSIGFLFYDLFSVTPVAYNLLIEQMPDGVIVLDRQQRIVDFNPAAEKYFRLSKTVLGQNCAQVIPQLWDTMATLMTQSEKKAQISLSTSPVITLEVDVLKITKQEKWFGTLLSLRDISDLKSVQEQLNRSNTDLELAVEQQTRQLNETISRLLEEISTRKRRENDLKQIQENLANRLSEQNRQLTAIYETILLSGTNRSKESTYQQMLINLQDAIRVDSALIYHYQKTSETFHLLASTQINTPETLDVIPAGWMKNSDFTRVIHSLHDHAALPQSMQLSDFTSAVFAPIHLQKNVVGMLGLYWLAAHQPSVEEIALINAMADQIGIIQENARLRQQIETKATQEERRRLSRELHDLVTQSIHSLVLSSDTAQSRLKNKNYARLENTLALISESARQALKDMRLLLYELRLVRLEEVNLYDALQTRIESVEKRAGIQASLTYQQEIVWPIGWQGEIYAIVMEAMNNSLKYARASQIVVTILTVEKIFEVTIKDNGVGFDQTLTSTGHQTGIGFHSMKERADKLGGMIFIQSGLGEGTQIKLKIPIPELQEVG